MSQNFSQAELRVEGAEQRVQDNAEWLCENVLEPIRRKWGPLAITSGYRPPARNQAAGGKPTSFHLFEADQAACDFKPMAAEIVEVFDWMRLESGLPIDKVILEHDKYGKPHIIHAQVFTKNKPRREAYLGGMGDAHDYQRVEMV